MQAMVARSKLVIQITFRHLLNFSRTVITVIGRSLKPLQSLVPRDPSLELVGAIEHPRGRLYLGNLASGQRCVRRWGHESCTRGLERTNLS